MLAMYLRLTRGTLGPAPVLRYVPALLLGSPRFWPAARFGRMSFRPRLAAHVGRRSKGVATSEAPIEKEERDHDDEVSECQPLPQRQPHDKLHQRSPDQEVPSHQANHE